MERDGAGSQGPVASWCIDGRAPAPQEKQRRQPPPSSRTGPELEATGRYTVRTVDNTAFLICIYRKHVYKLSNGGIIEIHRIYNSAPRCTYCENSTFI